MKSIAKLGIGTIRLQKPGILPQELYPKSHIFYLFKLDLGQFMRNPNYLLSKIHLTGFTFLLPEKLSINTWQE